MLQLLSPSYTHEKLENPQFEDLVDMFEDCWKHYIFAPCELLLSTPHGEVATITLLCSYYEAIACYLDGNDTNRRSGKAFAIGFCEVFPSAGQDGRKAADEVYKYVRCGVAHEGLLRHKVHYSREGSQSFFLTYPKIPGTDTLDLDAGVKSIVVNPVRMYRGTRGHFESYVGKLRDPANQALRQTFQTAVTRQWNLDGEQENIIAVTEDEFRGVSS